MKNILLTIVAFLSCIAGFSQNINFEKIQIKKIKSGIDHSILVVGSFNDTLLLRDTIIDSNGLTNGICVLLDSLGEIKKTIHIKSSHYSSVVNVLKSQDYTFLLSEVFNNVIVEGSTYSFNQLGYLITIYNNSDFTLKEFLILSGGELKSNLFYLKDSSLAMEFKFKDSIRMENEFISNSGEGICEIIFDKYLNLKLFKKRDYYSSNFNNIVGNNVELPFVYKLFQLQNNDCKIQVIEDSLIVDSVVIENVKIETINTISYDKASKIILVSLMKDGLNDGAIVIKSVQNDKCVKYKMNADYLYFSNNYVGSKNLILVKYSGSLAINELTIGISNSDGYNSTLLEFSKDTFAVLYNLYNVYGGEVFNDTFLHTFYNFISNNSQEISSFKNDLNLMSNSVFSSSMVSLNSVFSQTPSDGFGFLKGDDDKLDLNGVKIFPNPGKGNFMIKGDNFEIVRIYNQIGQEISFDIEENKFGDLIRVKNPLPGIYYLLYSDGQQLKTGQIIIE